MKTIIYFLLTVIGLTGSVVGTIRLGSFGLLSGDAVMYTFTYTFISMGVFTLFGYALRQHFVKDTKN